MLSGASITLHRNGTYIGIIIEGTEEQIAERVNSIKNSVAPRARAKAITPHKVQLFLSENTLLDYLVYVQEAKAFTESGVIIEADDKEWRRAAYAYAREYLEQLPTQSGIDRRKYEPYYYGYNGVIEGIDEQNRQRYGHGVADGLTSFSYAQ